MKKILELTNQRSKSLEEILESLAEVTKNVEAAKESHTSAAAADTVVDLAKKWYQVEVQDSMAKSKKIGYAEACRDITVILNQVLSAITEEHQKLQEILEEIIDAAEVSNPEEKGKTSDPLS